MSPELPTSEPNIAGDAQTLAGDPPIYAKILEIDHVPRRPSYTGEPPEARRALLNMRGNYGCMVRFVLNLGLFMNDRSLFGVCSVKNGGFAKKVSRIRKKLYPGLTKSILDSQKNILDSQKNNMGWWMEFAKIYPGMKNGGFAKKYTGFSKKYPGFAKKYPGFAKKNRGLMNANPAFKCRIKPSI